MSCYRYVRVAALFISRDHRSRINSSTFSSGLIVVVATNEGIFQAAPLMEFAINRSIEMIFITVLLKIS